MQAQLNEIAEVMNNIENIEASINDLKDSTTTVFTEQKTFDERMANGIKQLLESFKQREQELLERVQSASANSPSAAAATQNEQLSAEITRLKARLEALDAAFKLSETNVRTQEVRIKELEAEVATLKLHNSEGTDEDDDEAFRSANTSESESDTGNEDTTSQVPLQDTDAQTQNSTTPVAGGGGMFSVASQAASAAASVASHIGGLISGSSGAVTPRPQPPDTSIVPVPVNDQTQDTVAQVNDQGPEVLPSNSDPDNEIVNDAEAASAGASAADSSNTLTSSLINSRDQVLEALRNKVLRTDTGNIKYKTPVMKKAANKRLTDSVINEVVIFFATTPLKNINAPNQAQNDQFLDQTQLDLLMKRYDELYGPKSS